MARRRSVVASTFAGSLFASISRRQSWATMSRFAWLMSVMAKVVPWSSGTARMSRMSRRVKPIEPAPIMAMRRGDVEGMAADSSGRTDEQPAAAVVLSVACRVLIARGRVPLPRSLRLVAWITLIVSSLAPVAWAKDDATVDFARDVRPILSDNCFKCHGPDAAARKGELRLDVLDPKLGPLAKRDGYAVVAPGNLDDSVMISRVTSDDPDEKMPPAKANRTLSAAQIETLKKWVAQGAKWGKHWSFEKPLRPAIPAVKNP